MEKAPLNNVAIISNQEDCMSKDELLALYELWDAQYVVTNNNLSSASYCSNSNFSLSNKYPRHRWFNYKEGFSPILVEKIFSEFEISSDSVVCDPFCGAGTTLAVAQSNNIKSYGFEVNPFASFICKVKTTNYDEIAIEGLKKIVDDLQHNPLDTQIAKPDNEYLCRIFETEMLSVQQNIKEFIGNVVNSKAKELFYFAWLCTLEDCSLFRKAGNGLKIKTKKPEYGKGMARDFAISKLLNRIDIILEDLNVSEIGPSPTMFCESATELSKCLKTCSVDLVLFSPPYANCFDYTKIYYLELWFGGFISSKAEQKAIRMNSVRSHVHSTWPERYTGFHLDELNKVLIPLISEKKLWTSRIPSMLNGYFADMEEILCQIYNTLKPRGSCAIVVSNSAYGGIVVPTDVLLAKIAERIGFKVKEIQVERLIITSSQQYKATEFAKKYLRESIVKLIKSEE